MSHFALRKETDCLNCGTNTHGRYCHVCGQENIEPRETAWHLVTHFIYDITHFDGKFFTTLKYLLLRPGFLSIEYIKGRRASYLNPIKMYVFISAFFFLYFFSVSGEKFKLPDQEQMSASRVKQKIEKKIFSLKFEAEDTTDSADERAFAKRRIDSLNNDLALLEKDSTRVMQTYYIRSRDLKVTFFNKSYRGYGQYDSIQKALPPAERDGYINRQLTKRFFELALEAQTGNYSVLNRLFSDFLHRFPQLLFISLPIFALLLQLLYIRNKKLFYVDHAIFTVHLYCAFYILIFIFILVLQLQEVKYLGWIGYLEWPLVIAIYFYQYKALRTFYEQSRGKTIFKQLIQNILASFVMIFLAITFFFISAIFFK